MHFLNFNRSSNSTTGPGTDDEQELLFWKNIRAIAFDVDSTVTIDEGIDELAKFLGCGEQIAEITKQAMDEGLDFTQALEKRLGVMQPSVFDIEHFLKISPLRLTNGIDSLISRLMTAGFEVYLVTGGLDLLVRRVAEALKIPMENVYCNSFNFANNGSYKDFDRSQLTSRSGGKKFAIGDIQRRLGTKFSENKPKVLMIGDGITDAEASPPAHAFIGFGANVVRSSVKAKSRYFVRSAKELEKFFEEKRLLHHQENHNSPFTSLKLHLNYKKTSHSETT